MERDREELAEKGVRVRVIGDRSRLSAGELFEPSSRSKAQRRVEERWC